MTYPSGESVFQSGYPGDEGRWRAGAFFMASSERRSTRPSGAGTNEGAVSRRARISAGKHPCRGIGAQPNRRVKLAAPTPDGSAATWRCGVVALW